MNFLLLQVIAFSDEEGVRFHSTFLGSAALAGVLPVTALQISDKRFPWITSSLYLLMILFIISLFMHNPFLVAWQCKMYVIIIIIYRWCTSSMIYELNFCYMLKGIQESNFCNNIQGFQCLFSQPIGQCWMLIFFFIHPLKILLPYPQTAMILHNSEQICYMSAIKHSLYHTIAYISCP